MKRLIHIILLIVIVSSMAMFSQTATISNHKSSKSELPISDIRIDSVIGQGYKYAPDLVCQGWQPYKVLISNLNPKKYKKVLIEAYINDKKVTKCDTIMYNLSSDISEYRDTINIDLQHPHRPIGESFSINFKLIAIDIEGNKTETSYKYNGPIYTTSYTANENITDITDGTGYNGESGVFGYIYELGKNYGISGVRLGFLKTTSEVLAKSKIAIEIYCILDNAPMKRVYYNIFERGYGGIKDIDFRGPLLESQKILVVAKQLSNLNMGIAHDPNTTTKLVTDFEINKYTNNITFSEANSIFLRTRFFKSDSEDGNEGPELVAILSPDVTQARFSDSETFTIVTRYPRKGYKTTDMYACIYNEDVQYKMGDIFTIEGYRDTTLTINNFDLSRPGKHDINIELAFSNPSVVTEFTSFRSINFHVTFTTDEPLNPKHLTFEDCQDFKNGGQRYNPEWISFDTNQKGKFLKPTTKLDSNYYENWGESNGFLAFNVNNAYPSITDPNFMPHSGYKMGVAWCIDTPNMTSDTWLMSPKIRLGEGSQLSLYAKGYSPTDKEYKPEPYEILVSTSDSEKLEDFEVIGESIRYANNEDWEYVSVDLSEYDNKEVTIAIRYKGKSRENFCLMLDDIDIITDLSNIKDIENISPSKGLFYNNSKQRIELLSDDADYSIEIFNLNGQKLLESSNKSMIDVSMLPSGLYIALYNGESLKFAK